MFILLRGGSRDGETTTVSDDVERVLAASQAPGLIEAYQSTGDTETVAGNPGPAMVYAFTEQLPLGELGPEMIHMPQSPGS